MENEVQVTKNRVATREEGSARESAAELWQHSKFLLMCIPSCRRSQEPSQELPRGQQPSVRGGSSGSRGNPPMTCQQGEGVLVGHFWKVSQCLLRTVLSIFVSTETCLSPWLLRVHGTDFQGGAHFFSEGRLWLCLSRTTLVTTSHG